MYQMVSQQQISLLALECGGNMIVETISLSVGQTFSVSNRDVVAILAVTGSAKCANGDVIPTRKIPVTEDITFTVTGSGDFMIFRKA